MKILIILSLFSMAISFINAQGFELNQLIITDNEKECIRPENSICPACKNLLKIYSFEKDLCFDVYRSIYDEFKYICPICKSIIHQSIQKRTNK